VLFELMRLEIKGKMNMAIEPTYVYHAQVIRVIDGDTIDIDIDLGFDIRVKTRVRMYGINTPEMTSKNLEQRNKAEAAKEFLKSLIEGKEVLLQAFKHEKYGRYLANVYLGDLNINQRLISEGYAIPYFGGAKE
jgi:micrococcal nuclease